jgi:hypothetical protein
MKYPKKGVVKINKSSPPTNPHLLNRATWYRYKKQSEIKPIAIRMKTIFIEKY